MKQGRSSIFLNATRRLDMIFMTTKCYQNILEGIENASPYFCIFLQTVYASEKLLAGLNVQPRIGMKQSLIWLHY